MLAIVVMAKVAPNTATAVSLCVVLIGLAAVPATLSRQTDDFVRVLEAVSSLIHGRGP